MKPERDYLRNLHGAFVSGEMQVDSGVRILSRVEHRWVSLALIILISLSRE